MPGSNSSGVRRAAVTNSLSGAWSPAQLGVLRHHVGQTGGVGEQVADQDPLLEPALKLGQVALHPVGEGYPALVHQQHQSADTHRLADGGHNVDGVRLGGGRPGAPVQPSESLVEHHPAVAGHQDGGRAHPAPGGLFPQAVGDLAEARRRHSHLGRITGSQNGGGAGTGSGMGDGGRVLRGGPAAGEGGPAHARQAQGPGRQHLPPGVSGAPSGVHGSLRG